MGMVTGPLHTTQGMYSEMTTVKALSKAPLMKAPLRQETSSNAGSLWRHEYFLKGTF